MIAFLASMGFVAGEYLFEQMSSVKTRKHYVLGDLGFSGTYRGQINVLSYSTLLKATFLFSPYCLIALFLAAQLTY